MHELSIARYLVESIEQRAGEIGAARVVAIDLAVGERSGVVEESLRFCFDVIAAGTLAENAKLRLHPIRMRFRCAPCGEEYHPALDRGDFACPRCRAPGTLVDDGSAVQIESLEVET